MPLNAPPIVPADAVDRAILDVLKHGVAVTKTIRANEVGGISHQTGFLLPRPYWRAFSSHPPTKGKNLDEQVDVEWPDGTSTCSRIVWYGTGTRSEYRLTRFGRGFRWLDGSLLGAWFVLVRVDTGRFRVHILTTDADREQFESHFNVDLTGAPSGIGVTSEPVESETCIDEEFDRRTSEWAAFPSGDDLCSATIDALSKCQPDFPHRSPDERLLEGVNREYELFRRVERRLCLPEVTDGFPTVEAFLRLSQMILQRRKARAGRSLENHADRVFRDEGLPHEMRPKDVDGTPDIVFPSARAYRDDRRPADRIVVLGVKTSCRDRWRQVTREARRVPEKFILTKQAPITSSQLKEMQEAGVRVVVPQGLHREFPTRDRAHVLTLAAFVEIVRTRAAV